MVVVMCVLVRVGLVADLALASLVVRLLKDDSQVDTIGQVLELFCLICSCREILEDDTLRVGGFSDGGVISQVTLEISSLGGVCGPSEVGKSSGSWELYFLRTLSWWPSISP